MKQALLLFLFLLSCQFSFAQIQSSCTDNAALISNAYAEDINYLAVNRLYQIKHPDTVLAIVPQVHKDSIRDAIIGVFNLGTIYEADSVFNYHCVRDFRAPMYEVFMYIDTTLPWTMAWRNMQTTTSNATLNQLLANYNFSLKSYYGGSLPMVVLETNQLLNLRAFCDSLQLIQGIINPNPNGFLGGGKEIYYDVMGGQKKISFQIGWDDCPAGCISHKKWTYYLDNNCNISGTISWQLFQYSGPQPAPINCNLGPSNVQEFTKLKLDIYPNPTNSYLNIRIGENGIIKLLDVTGAVIKNFEVAVGENQLDISNQASGIYFLQFKNENGTAIQKIVKE